MEPEEDEGPVIVQIEPEGFAIFEDGIRVHVVAFENVVGFAIHPDYPHVMHMVELQQDGDLYLH